MTVEIIGYAAIAPGALSAVDLFQQLREGVCSVTEVPASRWDKARFWHPLQGMSGKTYTFAAGVVENVHDFDPVVFGLSRREAMAMDPQQRLLLSVAWRALEDASLPLSALQDRVVGVYVGASSLDSANLSAEDPASGGPYFMTGNTLSIVANRLSHIFGLNGPSLTIDTACSSSLVALDQAVRALERGEVDTAIVGGVNLLNHPLPFVGFAQARMLSPEGRCRAYDNDASGYVRSEGAVAIVLRRTDLAKADGDRSRARIIATGVNSAGRTNGISLPSAEAQVALLRGMYDDNRIDPNDLAFLEGHGTGTKVGDPAEVRAIGQVIGKRRRAPLPIGSIKTNIGHTEPASGLFGLLKAVMSLEQNFLPASLFFEKPNETIDFEDLNVRVNSTPLELLRSRRPRLAGVNSFGFGGTNAHVVIGDPERVVQSEANEPAGDHYFVASAHTESALRTLVDAYVHRMDKAAPTQVNRIVAASGGGRTLLRHRLVGVPTTPDKLKARLAAFLESQAVDGIETGEVPAGHTKIAFAFAGNGAQWAGMGVSAYRRSKAFKRHFDAASALFETHLGEKLVELLVSDTLDERLSDTRIAQPLLFSIQVATANALAVAGIRPACVFGHSIGEVAAAHIAGAMSLVDAVAVVAARSRCQHATRGRGTMAAALCSEEVAKAFLADNAITDVVVAAVNARNSITFSGPRQSIEEVKALGRRRKIAVQLLDIEYPFHHPLIDDVREEFVATLPDIGLHDGDLQFLSTVTGDRLSGRKLNASYWWRNAREPVAFRNAVAKALDEGCNLFLEISPRPILSNYIKETVREHSANAPVLSSLSKDNEDSADPIAQIIARLFAFGADGISLNRLPYVDLPSVPFEPETLTVPATTDTYDLFGRNARPYTLAGWRVDPNAGAWKNHIDAALFPDLAEHVVEGRAIMPGAGLVEIALQVARQHLRTDQVTLTNVELLNPLPLDDKLLELSTIVSAETGVIEIRSRERLSDDDWTLHAVARCQKMVDAQASDIFDAHQVTADRISKDRIYAIAAAFGLDYGPSFQRLNEAATDGGSRIVARLAPAADPAHPLLEWAVSPMSLDAAFHGLVGLFDRLSGDAQGSPYIPVRFGVIHLLSPGADIHGALIEIQKFSAHSIKARFQLTDQDGNAVLVIEDCRFRRTSLRQHRSIPSLGFHYEVLPWNGNVLNAPVTVSQPLISLAGSPEPDDSSLLLQAAVLRSCLDISMGAVNADGIISTASAPQEARVFLSTCLSILQSAGLAASMDDGWRLAGDIDLPEVAELLREFEADRPDRGAEAVAVASIRAAMMARLDRGTVASTEAPVAPTSATADYLRQRSAAAEWRNALLVNAVETLAKNTGFRPLTLVQIGATAPYLVQRVLDLLEPLAGRLAVFEPDDELRRSLEILFQDNPRIEIVKSLEAAKVYDAVYASSDRYAQLIINDETNMSAVRSIVAAGARLLIAESASSLINDFMNGVAADQDDGGVLADLHLGHLATTREWKRHLAAIGLDADATQTVEGPYGPVNIIDTRANDIVTGSLPSSGDHVLLVSGSTVEADGASIALDQDAESLAAAIVSSLSQARDRRITFVYARGVDDGAPSRDLTDDSWKLTHFARTLHQVVEEQNRKSSTHLVLLLQGGAPIGRSAPGMSAPVSPINVGLWSLARVLQNELESLDIFLFDAAEAEVDRALMLAALDQSREWIIGAGGDDIREIRAVEGALSRGNLLTTRYPAATIRQRTPSRVDALYWEACDLPQPEADQVVVEVAAAGLNFRDVMWAMGLLPEEALEEGFAGATIGMELSGRVAAIGAAVSDLKVGDAVMGIGPAAFSTHAVISRAGLAKVPAEIDLKAAATVPVTFLTAWYAIVVLARAQAGETLLVHGAAGGVGLAAIQIARALDLTVIATVGSEEKKAYLKMLGVEHVFNSRSLSFVADVKRVTGGEGVDMVLNSLFSDAMEQSIGLVKPFGRFLELGKRDYYADRKIGLRPFRRNVSYFGIDADQLPLKAPALTKEIFETLGQLFAEGKLAPLPYRRFQHDEIGDAFRLMQNAGHVGKIVIEPPVLGKHPVARKPASLQPLPPIGLHIVVGGIGGFGLAAAEWLVARGAREIALVTRRGVADDETAAAMRTWQDKGVNASCYACDVTSASAVEELLQTLRKRAPIKGVVHAAMVLDDALVGNLTRERFETVIAVKAAGAANLDRATREDALDYFLMFSSATTLVGNPGQANYVAANGYLEGLARRRRQEGLPGLAVGFGAIADTGYLAHNASVNDVLSRRLGNSSMKAATALAFVEHYMAVDPGTVDGGVVICSPIDWQAAKTLQLVNTPLFEIPLRQLVAGTAAGSDTIDLAQLVADKSEAEAMDLLFKLVASEMANVLRISEGAITRNKVLKDAGLDSLMAVELSMSFKDRTGVDMPLTGLGDTTTVDHVVRKLYERVMRQNDSEDEELPHQEIEALASQHLDAARKTVGEA
ncbi:type I polyketide synthase [Rhizobium sp. SL86]|uniref:type I polyketide synthase n=1 Tax=Rhizobium sp. SL86 TaxID=2995148 RepID=UPI002272582E|nr:type I polyketide synthase [Rhizobium sp. SL86]MCY1664617.1 type I polyketide synthase [Rhizobium sp. SL86]